jgi:hypothetical protein
MKRDSDHDGLPDRWEIANRLNPRKAADAKKDTDRDGLRNRLEFALGGNPRSVDTDRDGVDDGVEAKLRTKLNKTDSDGDGIKDGDDDANHDGICDRDQREALGTITSFDGTAGALVVTTSGGEATTYTITNDTEIEQREHPGWAHRPQDANDDSGDDNSDDSTDPSSDDSSDDSGDDWVEGDAGDMPAEDDSADSADPSTDPVDVVAPDNVSLLTSGTVVLKVKTAGDGTVTEIKLA